MPSSRTSARSRRAAPLAALALLLACAVPAGAQAPDPGVVHERVECQDFPGQSYALYLPSGYTRERAWPIVYCFDPAARGTVPVGQLREAAEKLGFILAGSNNARNGPWLRSHAAADAMVRDTQIRLRIDRRLAFAAGFSGGARVACRVAEAGDFAGVIACGAGFSGGVVPAEVRFAFFGTAGREDFNYQEMCRTDAELGGRGTPHRLVIFDGAHEWLPPALGERALEWLKLQAVRSGAVARDDRWTTAVFESRMREASGLRDEAQAWLEFTALASDFAGLVDTTGVARRAAELERSRAVRRHLADERRSAAREERWLARVEAAMNFLLEPAAREAARPRSGRLEPGPWRGAPRMLPGDAATPAAAEEQASLWDSGTSMEPPSANETPALRPEEPLLDLVRELKRAGPRDAAARRALMSAFTSLLERAREAMEGRDFPTASLCLETATRVRPEDPGAHYRLACVRAALGERGPARRSLDAAIAAGFSDQQRINELIAAVDTNDNSITELEPFIIRDLPALETSFGLALGVTADPETRQILRLTVKSVAANSEAEVRGFRTGTVILAADGRSVQSLIARFTRDSDFHRLFMERRDGDTIELRVVVRPGESPRVIRLTQGRDAHSADRPWMVDTAAL